MEPAYLGPLATELDGHGLAAHTAYRTVSVTRRFHWKLIIDAFLDGYHIKRLHRDSVYRFFLDNVNVADAVARTWSRPSGFRAGSRPGRTSRLQAGGSSSLFAGFTTR
jgi:Ring hydroxylating alpha subunit (catalytic domain)